MRKRQKNSIIICFYLSVILSFLSCTSCSKQDVSILYDAGFSILNDSFHMPSIYYIDFINIDDAIILKESNDYYITTTKELCDTSNHLPLFMREGCYLLSRPGQRKYGDGYKNLTGIDNRLFNNILKNNIFVDFEKNIHPRDTVSSLKIYSFNIYPKKFLRSLVKDQETQIWTNGGGWGQGETVSQNKYKAYLLPIYSKKQHLPLNLHQDYSIITVLN